MLGLEQGIVRLETYSPGWKDFFCREQAALTELLSKLVVDIQHIGSTAIPSIKAKPIIDICIGLKSLNDWPRTVEPMESLEYEYRGELGIPGRHFFGKGNPRVCHVHMVAFDSEFWREHLLFRDYLIAHPQVASEYSVFKEQLALNHSTDRDTYTSAKDPLIKRILAEASEWKRG